MPMRSVVMLIIGVVVALGTAYSLKSRMNTAKAPDATRILIAAAEIPAGSFVRSGGHIVLAEWPKDNITDSMLVEGAFKPEEYDGAVARRAITKGEPITKTMLVKSNEGGFMSAVLEPGKRAISIAVDSTTGNAGFIFPGDRVDLILTHSIDVTGGVERASETFVSDVRVLAIDQMLDNPENKAVLAKTVTIEVTPKEAEEVNVAKDLGKISLSLRSLAQKPQISEEGNEAQGTAESEASAEPETPLTLDDMLNQALPESYDAPVHVVEPNITRDTDVSKVISPRSSEGSRVRVLRGGAEPVDVEFTRDGAPRAE